MVVQSTVELSEEDVLNIQKAVYKHHEAFLAVVYSGDMYPRNVLFSWFQTVKFNIWTTDFNGDTDDYFVEVCPRDYPNDVPENKDKFVRPTEFNYSYATLYSRPVRVYEIELPREYWSFFHYDIDFKIRYIPGCETWPSFQSYAREGYITDVPEELLTDDPYYDF